MIELLTANGIAFAAVLLLGLLVAWWVWGRARPERRRSETSDVLTPGAAPAARNALLVDAPPASAAMTAPIAGLAPGTMAGMGEVIAAATAREIDDAEGQRTDLALDRPPIPPPLGDPDDLTRIKGVGPKLRARLTELGITRYDQIAAWTVADVAAVDPFLGAFQGRIARDNWIEQCGYLAKGDIAGFEERYGKV